MRDTIIIGAGLSGLMGTLRLAEAGQRPLLLAKGNGKTHWAPGTIDVWGTPGEHALGEALDALIAARPDHPYALGGRAVLGEAVARFQALMADARYPYVGSLERNLYLPTAAGALRPAALVPATMAAGDMRLGGPILIAGFRELRDFFPPLAADNLRAQGYAAEGIYLELPASTRRRLDFNPRSFAELFDQPEFRRDVGRQLRERRNGAVRIGLPAVLGLRDPLGVVGELQALSGAQIFEIPTLTPSVPGMRLFEIFRAAITRAGGRVQLGSLVVRATGADGRLTAVYTEAAARTQEHRAERVLLATGGIGGGGVHGAYDGVVRETALNLPLRAPDGRGTWFASRFLHEDGHPIFRAGVAVDGQQRPVSADGTIVYGNVAVAGEALAGADPLRERCATGIALSTGWRAGGILR